MQDPFERFESWWGEAKAHQDILEPTAMAVATADGSGDPSVRMVLLKDFDRRGFVFYTNAHSEKGASVIFARVMTGVGSW